MALSALWTHFGGHTKSVDLRHLACAQTENATFSESARRKQAAFAARMARGRDLADTLTGPHCSDSD